jgi:hypothetical protein
VKSTCIDILPLLQQKVNIQKEKIIMAKSHKDWLTDEQVEKEIERLKQTPEVKLAKKDEQIRYRRRQYLYCLRQYEKKGKALMEAGITMEMLEKMDNEGEE